MSAIWLQLLEEKDKTCSVIILQVFTSPNVVLVVLVFIRFCLVEPKSVSCKYRKIRTKI